MKESLLEILCCPLDKHDLELEDADYDEEEVVGGNLVCTECGEAIRSRTAFRTCCRRICERRRRPERPH